MIDQDTGPVYGLNLLDKLPLGTGGMLQALPSSSDLQRVLKVSQRTVAGYEVLLWHYRQKCDEVAALRELLAEAQTEIINATDERNTVAVRIGKVLRELEQTTEAGNG